MPKMKTNKSAAKRFKLRKSGSIKRYKQGTSHILTKKSAKRKMHLRKGTNVSKADEKNIKTLLNA